MEATTRHRLELISTAVCCHAVNLLYTYGLPPSALITACLSLCDLEGQEGHQLWTAAHFPAPWPAMGQATLACSSFRPTHHKWQSSALAITERIVLPQRANRMGWGPSDLCLSWQRCAPVIKLLAVEGMTPSAYQQDWEEEKTSAWSRSRDFCLDAIWTIDTTIKRHLRDLSIFRCD